MSQEEKKKELSLKYEELYNKRPHHTWDEEKLQTLINEAGSVETAKEVKGNVFMGIEIDPRKDYEFKLKHKQNARSILSNEAKVWDDEKGATRLIKLCSTENSPYVDEQSDGAIPDRTVLCFNNGQMIVNGREANKIKYLLAFDGYDKKSKVLNENMYLKDMYELVDKGKITENQVDREEAELEAKILVKGASGRDLSNFLRSRWLEDVDNMTDKEILSKGYKYAGEQPYIFLNDFTNPIHKIKGNVQKLFSKGLLDDANGVIAWNDTKGVILTIDPTKGVRADEALAKWVLIGSQEAKEFEKLMNSKL